MRNYMFCHLCKREFFIDGFPRHLKCKHQMTFKEYYDMFLKKETEGKCERCGAATKFVGRNGYNHFCSAKCSRKFAKTIEKMKQTNKKKYSCEYPSQSPEIQEKAKRTNLERRGVENVMQSTEVQEKVKRTNLEKYGVEFSFQSAAVKEKAKQTNLKRYGCENPMHNHDIFCKTKKKYEYNGIKFDSKPEIEMYQKLMAEGVDFEYQPNVCFEYEYDGKTHRYYPDFRVENEYIELKGAHFFKDGKMINPYDSTQDALYEAKHQCMLKNNVKIIIS